MEYDYIEELLDEHVLEWPREERDDYLEELADSLQFDSGE